MYKVGRNSSEFDVMLTIHDNDIYNSEFLSKLDLIEDYFEYPYNYNKGRLDLVSKRVYLSNSYYSIPAIFSRMHIDKDTSMKGIKFPSQLDIDNLLNT